MKEEFLKYALVSQLSVARRRALGGEFARPLHGEVGSFL
jgi:hypothetical protein